MGKNVGKLESFIEIVEKKDYTQSCSKNLHRDFWGVFICLE